LRHEAILYFTLRADARVVVMIVGEKKRRLIAQPPRANFYDVKASSPTGRSDAADS
jgi:hypothetical protein